MAAIGESWGRYPKAPGQRIAPLIDRTQPLPAFADTALPHGNGRSYGDCCLNAGGTLLHTRPMDRFISFDPACGVLRAEAGATLGEVLDLVVSQGWFLPVTPGTREVTLGGAIANDVHGKNHHRAGSFGHHIRGMALLRSDGARIELRPGDVLFSATVGGLGLTGVVSTVELQLRRIPGPWMETESIRFRNLEEFFDLSAESSATHEYTVAWIDCLASGRSLGRGHFTRANHASALGEDRPEASPSRLQMPLTPPISLVNRLTLRPFNWLYYHRQRVRRRRVLSHYRSYFYPLDGIHNWNRMYGPQGFLQHQCVLPPSHARDTVAELLREISRSGLGSFLAVLKEFGDIPSPGMLSFPRPGTTLALDFPNSGATVFALLDRLNRIVNDAGGAIYPAKDARMSGADFRKAFPAWQSFQAHIDPRFSSSFWRRVME